MIGHGHTQKNLYDLKVIRDVSTVLAKYLKTEKLGQAIADRQLASLMDEERGKKKHDTCKIQIFYQFNSIATRIAKGESSLKDEFFQAVEDYDPKKAQEWKDVLQGFIKQMEGYDKNSLKVEVYDTSQTARLNARLHAWSLWQSFITYYKALFEQHHECDQSIEAFDELIKTIDKKLQAMALKRSELNHDYMQEGVDYRLTG